MSKLRRGRLVTIDQNEVKAKFGDDAEFVIEAFCQNNVIGETLRKDFQIPVIKEDVKLSSDCKYVIEGGCVTLVSDIVKIEMEVLY